MSWFNRKSKRRSKIVKRRGSSAERLIFFARRFGPIIGFIVLTGWLGTWFFMSDADEKTKYWAYNKYLTTTADAGFRLQNILVEGRHYTDPQVLKAIINTEKNDPILGFNPLEAQEIIEKITWVKSVQVERRLPDTIFISIQERVPMALWQRNKRLSLIDMQGVILTDDNLGRFKNYIVVVGDEVPDHAPDFLQLLLVEPEIAVKVESAVLKSGRRWDLMLKSGALVKLPENDVALALRQLSQMQEDQQILDKDVKTIDVREKSRILVRTHPGAVQQYQAGYQKNNGGNAI